MRIALIKEHITTIEKSMQEIQKLSKEPEKNYNQLVRWIMNKEEHARKIQDIVSQYFLHQRINIPKEDAGDAEFEKYSKQLSLLHKILVFSMKAKQTTDLSYIKKLRQTVVIFEELYFHKH